MPLHIPVFKKNRRREPRPGYTDQDTPPYLNVWPPKKDRHDADTAEFTAANVCAQDQSLFCRVLPPEIRMLIFEYTIGNHLIHVDFDYQAPPPHPEAIYEHNYWPLDRLADYEWQWWYTICMGSDSHKRSGCEAQMWYNDRCQRKMVPRIRREGCRSTLHKPNPQLVKARNRFRISIGLLTLCKKLYPETMFTLYSKNTFDFQRPTLLSTHLSKLWTLPQLKLLRSVQIRWYMQPSALPHSGEWNDVSDAWMLGNIEETCLEYNKFWATLAELPCLSTLRVALFPYWILLHHHHHQDDDDIKNSFPVENMRTAWLRPIDRLKDKPLSRFELALGFTWVQVLWSKERAYTALGEDLYLPSAASSHVTGSLVDENEPFTLIAYNDTAESTTRRFRMILL